MEGSLFECLRCSSDRQGKDRHVTFPQVHLGQRSLESLGWDEWQEQEEKPKNSALHLRDARVSSSLL